MSSVSFATALPERITVSDVAAMAAVDEHHRFELSAAGVLSVMSPADPDRVMIVSRLSHWFCQHGYGWEQVAADCGIAVGSRSGGRVPDLTIWAEGRRPSADAGPYTPVDGLLLAVEVISPASEAVDRVTKMQEYADAGIPRYWLVERDPANSVTRYDLDPVTGHYEAVGSTQPLSWLVAGRPPL